jgi:hypothetical protein
MTISDIDERLDRTAAEQKEFDKACVRATEASALRSLAWIRDAIVRNDGRAFCSGPADANLLNYLLKLGFVSRTVIPNPAGARFSGLRDRVEWQITDEGAVALADAGL